MVMMQVKENLQSLMLVDDYLERDNALMDMLAAVTHKIEGTKPISITVNQHSKKYKYQQPKWARW